MRPPRSLMFKRIAKYKGDSNELCKFLDFSLYLYSNFVYLRGILGDKLFPRGLYFPQNKFAHKKSLAIAWHVSCAMFPMLSISYFMVCSYVEANILLTSSHLHVNY